MLPCDTARCYLAVRTSPDGSASDSAQALPGSAESLKVTAACWQRGRRQLSEEWER